MTVTDRQQHRRTDRQLRQGDRAARRAAESGSGPLRDDAPPARFPGARNRFALLGEVLTVGILVTLVSLPIVTLPAALVAGAGHMRRFLRAEESTFGTAWSEFRAALLGGVLVALGAAALVLVLVLDIDLANSGALPGGPLVGLVGWVGLAGVALVLLTASGRWSTDAGWRAALTAVPSALRGDPAGAGYTVATAAFAVVVTWQLLPLAVPALGCVVLALVAIPERPRRGDGDDDVLGPEETR
ncbi:DUF624 domain-containing protein [Herbiconiux sp. CPCC 205716]|uniref:DUF624 domain-containing protein n=1 Tax=Herbiconiux gentiana TaxID=2970912 RepID=A0ABT2GJ82_9MICO|nr:DUF624 domain-containing protein [Herbiconiux gentiana]MCS5716257.1 DUF624 domain-containing protein [Herbiconiux gentiana]